MQILFNESNQKSYIKYKDVVRIPFMIFIQTNNIFITLNLNFWKEKILNFIQKKTQQMKFNYKIFIKMQEKLLF